MEITDEIFALFRQRGDGAYFGEPVTQTEHGLQAAHLAREAGASDALIAAALLHDIGHLMPSQNEGLADAGKDGMHEDEGEVYLAHWFSPEVTEPVRLHVAAKRYLCATDSAYHAALSPASQRSLELQGGPMSSAEVAEFEQNPHYAAALQLRRWDDQAKIENLPVPALETYRPLLDSLITQTN